MGGNSRQLALILKLQDDASRELRKVVGELDKADTSTRNWSGTLKTAAKSLLAVGVAAGGFLGYGVKIAADLETAEVGLTTLLGSSEEAAKTVARLKKEAARTPFELPGLTQATQLLTSVTKNGDRSIDILLDVGEALAAMGKGQAELDRIIVNLQQIAATGRAATIDIRQFAFAGIPIYEMLTETTGKSGEALEELITSGGVTFDLLTQMFDEANDAGGRFFNAFQNQSGTFNQALSNLKDSFGIFLADIARGSGLLDRLTVGMMLLADFMGNYRTHMENARQATAAFLADLDSKTGLVTLFKDAWANLVFVYESSLKPALIELWETLQPYKPFLEAMATVLGGMLVGAIAGLVIILGSLAAVLVEVLAGITRLIDYVAEHFFRVWDNLTSAIAGTVDWVDSLIDSLKSAIKFMSQLGSLVPGLPGGSLFKSIGKVLNVNDAIISPNGNIVSTHPDDWLIATKNPESLGGSGVVININGDVSGEELIDKVRHALGMDVKRMYRI